jgi:hypothetical protein
MLGGEENPPFASFFGWRSFTIAGAALAVALVAAFFAGVFFILSLAVAEAEAVAGHDKNFIYATCRT